MKDNKIKESKNNEKEENKNWVPIGMCIGLCMGTAIGAATNNIALWLPIGLCLGLSLGAAFSESKDKKDK
jgi:uncharacterized membrane protein YoaK (UPF0700 family)